MNKALEDLQAGRDRIAAGEPVTEDPTPYRRAANFSIALPLGAIFVTQVFAVTHKANPGSTGQLLARGGALLTLLLVLAGLLLAIKALRAKGVEMSERPFVRPIIGILFNAGLLALLIGGAVSKLHQGPNNALAARTIQVAAREAKSDLQKAAQENRPISPEQAEAGIQKMTSALDTVSQNASGPNAALARASRAYLLKIQPLANGYALAMKAVSQPPILDMSGVTGHEQLQSKKQLVRNFLTANDNLEAFATNRLELYRQELLRASVPVASIEAALDAYEKVSPEKDDLARRIRADDRYVGEALLRMLDLLEANLGKWQYDAERKKVQFDDDATLDKYIALRQQMELAAQEQKRLQARLLDIARQ